MIDIPLTLLRVFMMAHVEEERDIEGKNDAHVMERVRVTGAEKNLYRLWDPLGNTSHVGSWDTRSFEHCRLTYGHRRE